MKQTFWQRLRAVGRVIPGFRHPSQTSIAVAVTYYAAALAVTAATWPWGLALLAAPFFVFALADLGQSHSCRTMVTAGVAAALLLLGVALGLSREGYRLKPTPAHPALAQSTASPHALSSKPLATLIPSAAPSDPQTLVYIASKSSKVFHRPDCASARSIKPENLVQYATRDAAIAAGLTPCQKCKP